MKRIIALIMSLFLMITVSVNAYATGAEGAILGGLSGGSLAGLGLTGPEVALAVAALFGVAYAVDNADTIYTEMNNCINKVTDGLENQAAIVSDWWKEAAAGAIDTTSSVWSGICDWFTGTRDDYYGNTVRAIDCPAGTVYKILNNSYSCNSDTIAVPYFMIGQSGKYKDVHVGISFWSDTRFKGSYGSGDFASEYDSDTGLYYKLCEHALQTDDETAALKQLSNNNISQYGDLSFYYEGTYVKTKLMNYLRTLVSVKFDGAVVADSVLTGGIDKILNDGLIDSPADVIFPDTIVLNPDAVSDNGLERILEKVIAGEMAWTDYWEAVTSTSLPAVKVNDKAYELDNEGVSEKEADLSPSSALDDYKLDLTKLFPFCIPFDIYDLLNCLCAEPEAPKFTWTIPLSAVGLQDCKIEIDLKTWDSIAQIARNMELLAFCIGLAFVTRNLIRG